MKKWHLKLISRLLIATVCISMTTYRKNIEQVLFYVHWLNVPHSLKISGSFGNDHTETDRMEYSQKNASQKKNISEPTS